jgi:hypothetical protein
MGEAKAHAEKEEPNKIQTGALAIIGILSAKPRRHEESIPRSEIDLRVFAALRLKFRSFAIRGAVESRAVDTFRSVDDSDRSFS